MTIEPTFRKLRVEFLSNFPGAGLKPTLDESWASGRHGAAIGQHHMRCCRRSRTLVVRDVDEDTMVPSFHLDTVGESSALISEAVAVRVDAEEREDLALQRRELSDKDLFASVG